MSRAPATSSSVRMPSTGPRCWPWSSVTGVSHGRVTVNGTVCSASSASRNPPPTVNRSRTTVPSRSSSWPSISTRATRRSEIRSTVTSDPPPRRRTSPVTRPPGSAGPGSRTVSTEGPPTPRAPSNFLNTMCGVRSFCDGRSLRMGDRGCVSHLAGQNLPRSKDFPKHATTTHSSGHQDRGWHDRPGAALRVTPATPVCFAFPLLSMGRVHTRLPPSIPTPRTEKELRTAMGEPPSTNRVIPDPTHRGTEVTR